MRILMLFPIVTFLAGCSTVRMTELAKYDAEYGPHQNAEMILSATFQRSGSTGDLAQCMAEAITNRGETLSDSTGSFVGPYSGVIYNRANTSQVAGGSVIEQLSSDGSAVVATGSVRYRRDSLVTRSVRFTLTARRTGSGVTYRFSNLEQAQLETGYAKNTGYFPIGSWAAADPDKALSALESSADRVDACMRR